MNPVTFNPEGATALGFTELLTVLPNRRQKLGLQSLLKRHIPDVGIRIGGKGAGFNITLGTDMNKSLAGRQTAADFILITGNTNKQGGKLRAI